jgi:capsid protein
MLTYLRQLQSERDTLTQAATTITETAATETRDVTEAERASIETMSTRCAAIDDQLRTFSAQLESQRAYARLRVDLADTDDEPGGGEVERRGGGEIETGDADLNGYAAPFLRSGVIERYPGHGRSEVVELGSVIETRAPITTADLDKAIPRATFTPRELTWQSSLIGLVTTLPVSSGVVEWLRWGPTPPSEAFEVAEGALKQEADLTLTPGEDKLKTFAHWKAITRQALEDTPRIQAMIESRLRVGLQVKITSEVGAVINDDPDVPEVGGDSMLEGIRLGLAEFDDESGYTPNGVLLNPADWAAVDLDLLGRTLNGPSVASATWGLRFASSRRVPAGTAFVGDFGAAVTLFDRRVTGVMLTDSHADFFLRNQLVILAETRALAVMTEPLALRRVAVAAAPGNGGGGGE